VRLSFHSSTNLPYAAATIALSAPPAMAGETARSRTGVETVGERRGESGFALELLAAGGGVGLTGPHPSGRWSSPDVLGVGHDKGLAAFDEGQKGDRLGVGGDEARLGEH
jgi:hypothetical protein